MNIPQMVISSIEQLVKYGVSGPYVIIAHKTQAKAIKKCRLEETLREAKHRVKIRYAKDIIGIEKICVQDE